MFVIEAQNVRDALPQAVRYLLHYGQIEQTRAGEAIVARKPVTIEYRHPKQHVLLNPVRDANPFFHLMEAMWMLAGRKDGAFLDNYIRNFSKEFGIEGIIEDSYGYRWRYGCEFDQLDEIIQQMRGSPGTRQCVLQMWGAGRTDLLASMAKPCNLVATFRIQAGRLDMAVYNRSNDLVWGCCGANAVHFGFLQEYLATMIGVEIGHYWQISTNLHMYQKHIDMMLSRVEKYQSKKDLAMFLVDYNEYKSIQPLINFPLNFDDELEETMMCLDEIHRGQKPYAGNLSNTFLRDVVLPMARAYRQFREKDIQGALATVDGEVTADDWKRAGHEWLQRRA